MKVFISQPMNGKTEEQIKKERERLIENIEITGDVVLDTIFEFESNNPVNYLAKSIEKLAEADQVIFMNGWENARGCKIEFEIAKNYGKEILILKDGNK